MRVKKLEILVKQGVNHPDIGEENLDKETCQRLTGWIHNNRFTDSKLNNDCVNDVTVDIDQNKDWSISNYKEIRNTTIDGKAYVDHITKEYYNESKDQTNIEIPT